MVCGRVLPPLHRPGARHATRKLMAPPLRFFFLTAFVSLGNRDVLVCLSSTIRSQGFSPSQRFHPSRALRLCFAPLPPLGFLAFRAFPTQPAVTPLGIPCSFVVTTSFGVVGLPHPRHCPNVQSPTIRNSNAVLCHKASIRLDHRHSFIAFSTGQDQ
jgi:hypothetical protein